MGAFSSLILIITTFCGETVWIELVILSAFEFFHLNIIPI